LVGRSALRRRPILITVLRLLLESVPATDDEHDDPQPHEGADRNQQNERGLDGMGRTEME